MRIPSPPSSTQLGAAAASAGAAVAPGAVDRLAHVDPECERNLLEQLEETNDGPLSRAGLGVFHGTLLSLTKQELAP